MSDAKRFELRAVAGGWLFIVYAAGCVAVVGFCLTRERALAAALPGKVRLRFVEFTEEFVDPDASEFKERRFPLCDANDPIAREFIATLTGAAK
jgi:hypothetical protein